jgi:hypothetical protein
VFGIETTYNADGVAFVVDRGHDMDVAQVNIAYLTALFVAVPLRMAVLECPRSLS